MSTLREAATGLGLSLEPEQLVLFERYAALLLDWNRRVNLTRITEPAEIEIKHFLDCLTCLLVFPSPPAKRHLRLIDVGTGAGFPGLVLKIARPDTEVTLLDATAKKTAFLSHAVSELGLSGVDVVTARGEELAHQSAHRQRYDIAVARALAPTATLAEYCLPFVRLGGRMIAQKTEGIAAELKQAVGAFAALGGRLVERRVVNLPGLEHARVLLVVDKIAPTPARFPRAAGLPVKKPLGGGPSSGK